ncbi:hypothetical protein NRB16_07415 [Pseudomonas sp. LJDD11]|uniref:hypothetical protein n=1 Tax=Pseudomonas sp. LJDD11 TaxID=2931984 RepID=UPI00211C39A5|nr:hypothetical protein [Pseudomonas sp. LJDD11]MCQ9423350.1 hypothetical protein [Pseudomonas sp. LJDD11]
MRALTIFALVAVAGPLVGLAVAATEHTDYDAIVSAQDDEYGAVCWMTSMGGISCLPMSQLNTQAGGGGTGNDREAFASEQPKAWPTQVLTPAPPQHGEVFRL